MRVCRDSLASTVARPVLVAALLAAPPGSALAFDPTRVAVQSARVDARANGLIGNVRRFLGIRREAPMAIVPVGVTPRPSPVAARGSQSPWPVERHTQADKQTPPPRPAKPPMPPRPPARPKPEVALLSSAPSAAPPIPVRAPRALAPVAALVETPVSMPPESPVPLGSPGHAYGRRLLEIPTPPPATTVSAPATNAAPQIPELPATPMAISPVLERPVDVPAFAHGSTGPHPPAYKFGSATIAAMPDVPPAATVSPWHAVSGALIDPFIGVARAATLPAAPPEDPESSLRSILPYAGITAPDDATVADFIGPRRPPVLVAAATLSPVETTMAMPKAKPARPVAPAPKATPKPETVAPATEATTGDKAQTPPEALVEKLARTLPLPVAQQATGATPENDVAPAQADPTITVRNVSVDGAEGRTATAPTADDDPANDPSSGSMVDAGPHAEVEPPRPAEQLANADGPATNAPHAENAKAAETKPHVEPEATQSAPADDAASAKAPDTSQTSEEHAAAGDQPDPDETAETEGHGKPDAHGEADKHDAADNLGDEGEQGDEDEAVPAIEPLEVDFASPPRLEPLPRLMRMMSALQDDIAQGSSAALAAQRIIFTRVSAALKTVPDDSFRDPFTARALVSYALSGGSPADVRTVYDRAVFAPPYDALIAGSLAFMEGRESDAERHFAGVDVSKVPANLVGPLQLALAALDVDDDPDAALAHLDRARLAAPATLIEEAALRRSILIAAERDDHVRFATSVDRYLRKFRSSIYAGNFRRRFSSALTRMTFMEEPGAFDQLQTILAPLTENGRREIFLDLARTAVENGKSTAGTAAARIALQGAPEGSLAQVRGRLYAAAADVVNHQKTTDALETLDAIPVANLEEADRALRLAAISLGASVLDLPATSPPESEVARDPDFDAAMMLAATGPAAALPQVSQPGDETPPAPVAEPDGDMPAGVTEAGTGAPEDELAIEGRARNVLAQIDDILRTSE